MISHADRVIFIHVPKAAGTSVEAALGHHGAGGVSRGMQDHRSLRELQWPHGGVGQFRSVENGREAARAIRTRLRRDEHAANRLTVTREQYESYFKFGIVRNPWARAYSWYRNVLGDPLHRQRLGVSADVDLATFLARHDGVGLLRPQTQWLVDFSGRIGVDVVCRFERLAEDYATVCRRAGLPETILPHLNTFSGGAYVDAYDDRTRRVVAERHRAEIELFGYAFGDDVGVSGERAAGR